MQDQDSPARVEENFSEYCIRTGYPGRYLRNDPDPNFEEVSDHLSCHFHRLKGEYHDYAPDRIFSFTPIPENRAEIKKRKSYHTRNLNNRLDNLNFFLNQEELPFELRVKEHCDRLNRILWIKCESDYNFALGHFLSKYPNCSKEQLQERKRRNKRIRNKIYFSLFHNPRKYIENPELCFLLKPHPFHWDWTIKNPDLTL